MKTNSSLLDFTVFILLHMHICISAIVRDIQLTKTLWHILLFHKDKTQLHKNTENYFL